MNAARTAASEAAQGFRVSGLGLGRLTMRASLWGFLRFLGALWGKVRGVSSPKYIGRMAIYGYISWAEDLELLAFFTCWTILLYALSVPKARGHETRRCTHVHHCFMRVRECAVCSTPFCSPHLTMKNIISSWEHCRQRSLITWAGRGGGGGFRV